jgi:multidrug resistance protein, MATE family
MNAAAPMARPAADEASHGRVWRLATPVILSNVTVPLMGAVDTAVVGRLPEPWHIGAVAVGAMVFNFVYWGFAFLRMGTTGLTAQARGAGDLDEVRSNLARPMLIALAAGLALIALQWPIAALALALVEASAEVERLAAVYIAVRIWAAPAALANYALLGWFIGLGDTRAGFLMQVVANLANIALSILFVLGFEWGVAGVAAATLIAEWTGVLFGLAIARAKLARAGGRLRRESVFDAGRLRRLFALNRDIFLRTLCLIFAFAFFTAQGAKAGDVTLAANAVLMNFLHVMAFGLDGFAFAAEALVGAAMGARDPAALRRAVKTTTLWAAVCALAFAAAYAAAGAAAIGLLTTLPEVREAARALLPWAILAPLIGVWSFQLDGIFIGATRSADMRNGAALALLVYLAAWAALTPAPGKNKFWLAFLAFYAARAITLAVRYPALEKSVVRN